MGYEPDQSDKEWLKRQHPFNNTMNGIYRPKKIPPEPKGFRDWIKVEYPKACHTIAWSTVWQTLYDVVTEYEATEMYRELNPPLHTEPALPATAKKPKKAHKRKSQPYSNEDLPV